MTVEEATCEFTFEEEATLYEQEARQIFATEEGEGDAPGINNVIRRGMRIIRKAREQISALRAQQETDKNEPLTLEELKGMEGQPVFWKSIISPHCGEWRILNHFGEKMEYLDFAGKSPEMFCNYGKWYVCYRHPPKEAHNV